MLVRNSIFFILVCLFNSFATKAQTTICEKANMITMTAEKHHYQPISLDDHFSNILFDKFINQIDPNKLYFSTEDIEILSPFKSKLDDEIKAGNCLFIEKALELYKLRINKLNLFLEKHLETDFDFKQKDTLIFGESVKRLDNKNLESRWASLFKYDVLSILPDSLNSETEWSTITTNLNTIQKIVLNNQILSLKLRFETDEEMADYIFSIYLNAIASTYDPHTNYFTVEEERELGNHLSKNIVSFGLELFKNELGEVAVKSIIPGSMAWNSAKINEGDILVAIESNGNKMDLNNLPIKKVSNILNDEELTEAIFFIKKKRTEIIEVPLTKMEILNSDNAIESFVLDGDVRIGYIYLPAFYTNSFGSNFYGNGCANDMAKEIIKLKRQNIHGLIIDLRGNGGGAMLEAIRLSGSFINYGSLGIIDSRNEDPVIYKDLDRGILFRQPLAILVDQTSASASEFFASTMQHYNRAVVVGSQTYGKSTAQIVLPVNAYLYDNVDSIVNQPSKDGYLKITTSVFYDFDGTSYQNKGVQPDIALPNIYDEFPIGESYDVSSIQVGKIDKKTYAFPLDSIDVKRLKIQSESRVSSNPHFQSIESNIPIMKANNNQIKIPVNYYDYLKYIELLPFENDLMFSDTNTVFKVIPTSTLYNPEYILDKDIYTYDIKDDIYIQESYNILNDLIKFE